MSNQPNGTPGHSAGGHPVPEDERMAGIELRASREYLGLTIEWVAARLDVALRTVRRWEHDHSPIPDGVRLQVEAWEADTAESVGRTVEQLIDAPEPALVLPMADEECAESGWPARWHRHVAMRVAVEVPGLVIVHGQAA